MVRKISVSEQVRMQVPAVPSEMMIAKRRRWEKQGPTAGTKTGDGWRRSHHDELFLDAVTRLGAVTLSQACRYIYPHAYETVRKRLAKMVDAGLLNRIDTLMWAGSIFYPTRAGREVVVVREESPLLSMEPPAESTMLHRLLVAEEALRLMAEGKTIITEREARLYEMGTSHDSIDERNLFLAQKGVQGSIRNSPGVVPTQQGTQYGTVDRYLLVPTPLAESRYRIPDLFEVLETGELRAIEVELTLKRPARLRGILEGYRRACRGHKSEPYGSTRSLKEVGPLYRQFAGVQWVATQPVVDMLRGPDSGVNPISGKEDIGLVRPLWDKGSTTHLFYRTEKSKQMVRKNWPVSVRLLDLSHDPGLEYALHQMVLPARYRTPLRQWRIWREVWKDEVAGDIDPVSFPQWIRLPGQMKKLRRL